MAAAMLCTTNISPAYAVETQITTSVPDTKPTADIPGNLADGTYEIPVYLYQTGVDEASSLNDALQHTAKLIVENGIGTVYLKFAEIPFAEAIGHVVDFSYYDPDGTERGVAVDKTGTAVNALTGEEVQTLDQFHFALSTTQSGIRCRLAVDVLDEVQDARLVFDYSGLSTYTVADTSVLESLLAQAQAEEFSNADGKYTEEAAMDEVRGLRMSRDLETAKEETAAADGVKLVAASPQIAEICEKLDLDLAGVCAEDVSQVPERYQDVVITETEEQAVTEELGTFYDSAADALTDEKVAILVATKDGCVAATDASYLGDLIAIAGGSCAYTDEESAYTELDLKELSTLNVDKVLRVSSGLSKEEADEAWKELESEEEWQSLNTVQNGAVQDLDADLFGMDADLYWQEALKVLKEAL